MTRHLKRAAVLAIGWGLVGLGVVGLFLPLLQGVLLIAVGLYVLSRESRSIHLMVERWRGRHPALDRSLHLVSQRFRRHPEGGTVVEPHPEAGRRPVAESKPDLQA